MPICLHWVTFGLDCGIIRLKRSPAVAEDGVSQP
jgi:hypothetical protein